MYGTPVDVSLDDLVERPGGSYEGRAVRTHGRLEIDNAGTGSARAAYLLRDIGGSVYVTPVRELAGVLRVRGDAHGWARSSR